MEKGGGRKEKHGIGLKRHRERTEN